MAVSDVNSTNAKGCDLPEKVIWETILGLSCGFHMIQIIWITVNLILGKFTGLCLEYKHTTRVHIHIESSLDDCMCEKRALFLRYCCQTEVFKCFTLFAYRFIIILVEIRVIVPLHIPQDSV